MSYLRFKRRTELGPNQKKIMEVLKQRKEMKMKDIAPILGKTKPQQFQALRNSMYWLSADGLIEIKGKNPLVYVYKKDFVPDKPAIPKSPRKIIKIKELNEIIDRHLHGLNSVDSLTYSQDWKEGYRSALISIKEEFQ